MLLSFDMRQKFTVGSFEIPVLFKVEIYKEYPEILEKRLAEIYDGPIKKAIVYDLINNTKSAVVIKIIGSYSNQQATYMQDGHLIDLPCKEEQVKEIIDNQGLLEEVFDLLQEQLSEKIKILKVKARMVKG